jgi:hypothetical protein
LGHGKTSTRKEVYVFADVAKLSEKEFCFDLCLSRPQVFEYGTLAIGEQGLTSKHFEALVRYNDRHGCTLFKVGHQRLHFGSFVGVLQVGSLTIEILPKAEKANTADKGKWQRALFRCCVNQACSTLKPPLKQPCTCDGPR